MASPFDVSAAHVDGTFVVTPAGELDIATVGRLRAALDARADGEDLRLDLRRLEFLDTSGLQLLVELSRRADAQEFQLAVVRGQSMVQRVFEIAGLDGVLPFVDGDALPD